MANDFKNQHMFDGENIPKEESTAIICIIYTDLHLASKSNLKILKSNKHLKHKRDK